MHVYSVADPAFKPYGRVVEGFPVESLLQALAQTPLPEGTDYMPEEPMMQGLPAARECSAHLYGGMPVQLGWCNGRNTKLNCLEYHRDSEFNLGTEDFILLLARQEEMENGCLDTARIKAFCVPGGTLVEVYATTLHYAPCHVDAQTGFRVMVLLPAGTNLKKPDIKPLTEEDKLLWASNKWLLAHAESDEAKQGAAIRLYGENIELKIEQ